MLRALVEAALGLLLPRHCVVCDGAMHPPDAGLVCGACWSRLRGLPAPRCARCGYPQGAGGACRACAVLDPRVRDARSVCFVPDGVAGDILHAFKYGGWPALATPLGDRLARVAEPPLGTVVPVPLAPARRRERGFNQSALLAARVARRTGAPHLPDALRRTRATRAQAKLTAAERAANVHLAFAVARDAAPRIAGRHVTVVDDVLTTGATLNACAIALFDAGASGVSYLTVGRAHLPGEPA